jgi:hypothetical protein
LIRRHARLEVEALRQADIARQPRGRWARLRAALRVESRACDGADIPDAHAGTAVISALVIFVSAFLFGLWQGF